MAEEPHSDGSDSLRTPPVRVPTRRALLLPYLLGVALFWVVLIRVPGSLALSARLAIGVAAMIVVVIRAWPWK